MHTSRLARIAILVAAISALLFVGPPILVMLGALPGFVGFRLFLGGALLGLFALLFGLLALYTTRPARGRAGRGLAGAAVLIGASVLGILAIAGGRSLALPPINDITTDPDDPPQFAALLQEGPNAGRDMSYPGEEFAEQQRAGYPDLAPILVPTPPADTFQAAVRAMEGFGWTIVRADASAGLVEATDTSRIFRFVDDVAVRVRPATSGSRVDVRSKSRDGQGDLGANAERIRKLRDALT